MNSDKNTALRRLYEKWAGEVPIEVTRLAQSGSNRQYYRMTSDGHRCIGVIGENDRENEAFVSFAGSLRAAHINVPEVYAYDAEAGVYIQQDLGGMTLYDFLQKERSENGGEFTQRLKEVYKRVLLALNEIQYRGRTRIDFDKSYPRADFDKQSILWDLQYFKYYFLKLAGVPFDEQRLEADFETFVDYLLQANSKFFLYRDFQSRNIMLDSDMQPWFIDFQGGRRGARQYDVASLLYDAKADIPSNVRNELLAFYTSRLKPAESKTFIRYFKGYCMIRIMQAMGAYGYRGYFERKEHFLKSIPFALDNMKEILSSGRPECDAPELFRVLEAIVESESLRKLSETASVLHVVVSSFSYKHGIPVDTSGNGGGFVFDCRALPNPGREARYKQSTGRDADVLAFFSTHEREMTPFLEGAKGIVGISIRNYIRRGFANLAVNFGCTGGQHRSVYCADTFAEWVRKTFPGVIVSVTHHEQPQLK